MTDQHAELDAALERVIEAARAHLAAVKAAEGRVDDDDVWQAYVDAEQRLVRLRRAAARRVRRGHAVGRRVDRPGRGRPALRRSAGRATATAERPVPAGDLGAAAPRLPGAQRVRAAAGGRGGPARAARRTTTSRRRWRRVGEAVLELLQAGDGSLGALDVPELEPLDGVRHGQRGRHGPLDLEAFEDDDARRPVHRRPRTTGWSAGSTSTRSCSTTTTTPARALRQCAGPTGGHGRQ